MSKEAMKLALEALKRMKGYGNTFAYRSHEQNPHEQVCDAITALEALAEQKSGIKQVIELYDSPDQPSQQEPVAMRYDFDGYGWKYIDSGSGSDWQTRIKDAEPIYTTPPQRTWVGLTDEEILEAWCIHLDEGDEDEIEEWRHVINEAREIEAKLKEKNNA